MKPGLAILLVAGGLAAQAPVVTSVPPPNRPAVTGKASIQGKVLDALTHEPVRKATVTLNGSRNVLTAVTDAEGHFAFHQLLAGSYTIQAQSQKYPTAPTTYEPARQVRVSVTGEEEKSGVELALNPGGSVRGHVVDEEGFPMPNCQVAPTQFYEDSAREITFGAAGAQSDAKGEYLVENLPAGKYYVIAHCPQTVPLPHGLMPREDLRNAPALVYPPRFFPSGADPSGAAKVTVTPGSTVTGIDVQMAASAGFSVLAHLRPQSKTRLLLQLRSKDAKIARWQESQAILEPNTTDFRFYNVPRGSYDIVAGGVGEDCSCFVTGSVEIGDKPPEPLDVALAPAPRIPGAIVFDGDTKTPLANLIVTLMPRDPFFGQLPRAQVASDGTFALTVSPGRWQVQVGGAGGYIKSITMGDQEASPDNLRTGPGAAPLKITMGTKNARIEGTVSGYSPSTASAPFSGLLWTAGGTSDFQQVFGPDPLGRVAVSVPPGHYYVCAAQGAQTSLLLQNRPLRKALESNCASVEASADTPATVSIPLITADELKRLQDNLE